MSIIGLTLSLSTNLSQKATRPQPYRAKKSWLYILVSYLLHLSILICISCNIYTPRNFAIFIITFSLSLHVNVYQLAYQKLLLRPLAYHRYPQSELCSFHPPSV